MFTEVLSNEYVVLAYIIGYLGMFFYGRVVTPKYEEGGNMPWFVMDMVRYAIIIGAATFWPILFCYWLFARVHDFEG